MSDERRVLQIYRDGRRSPAKKLLQLPAGAEANMYTLSIMAAIVREDSREPDLATFAFREIIGLETSGLSAQIDAAYAFCRDRIVYKPEGPGTETVADLWSCMYALKREHPVGDCAIKSVALATVLSYLNLKPYFVAIRQIPNVDYFNHVFVGISEGGDEIGLDPTPPEFGVGDELGYLQRWNIPIFK